MDLWTPTHFIQRHGVSGLYELSKMLNSSGTIPIKKVMAKFGYGQSQSYNLINTMFERKYVPREEVREVLRMGRGEFERRLTYIEELTDQKVFVLEPEPDGLRLTSH